MSANANLDVFIGYHGLLARAQSYLGDADPRDPLASALYADLQGLPPLLIHVGSDEALLDDSTRLEALGSDFGIDVTLKIWDNMVHVWQAFASVLPEGQESIQEIGEFIRSKLDWNA